MLILCGQFHFGVAELFLTERYQFGSKIRQMAETAFDCILENLKQAINGNADLIPNEKDQIRSLCEELGFLRTFLKDWEGKHYEHQAANHLVKHIIDVANKAEDTIELYITKKDKKQEMILIGEDTTTDEKIGHVHDPSLDLAKMKEKKDEGIDMTKKMDQVFDPSLNLGSINERIEVIKRAVLNFHDKEKTKTKREKQPKDIGVAKKIGQGFFSCLNLGSTRKECEAIKTVEKQIDDIKDIQDEDYSNEDSSRANAVGKEEVVVGFDNTAAMRRYGENSNRPLTRIVGEEDIMVGFEEEAMMIKEKLTGGRNQLEIISIVGMPGLGKTTLAKKVYYDPLIIYHFYARAWISISQEYRKQDLLRSLLSSVSKRTNDIYKVRDDKLGEELRKRLKEKRYLIVMDDIWDIKAWVHLKSSFPNDNNGSRILFTSRLADVVLQAKPNNPPLYLRFLSEGESWDLFQQKAFQRKPCPPEFIDIGKKIAKICRGLPLTIVVAAGILANKEKMEDQWKQIGNSLASSIFGDPHLCTETLALSYNHLPQYLKPCFLYFGAFPEDYEIPAQTLIWLWVAEGFIQKTGEKFLEDVAEEYLMNLIGRSLVTVSKRRSDGAIKSCRMHDLLRDFCLQKAEEEYFLHRISGHQHFFSSRSSLKNFSYMRRLCVHSMRSNVSSLFPSALNTHSLLYIDSGYNELQPLEFLFRCFNLLRVLDISSIDIYNFPNELDQLVLLRYLALGMGRVPCRLGYHIPASISNLCNLETLIICTSTSSVVLPHSIWKMVKLRHLFLTGEGIHKIETPDPKDHYPSSLNSLHTLSSLDPSQWPSRDFLARTPNLRKLGFRGEIVSQGWGRLTFPDIYFLNHLQKLKLINTRLCISGWSTNLRSIKFPPNLTSLTLERTYLKWDEMSTLGKLLPNLEVLKLSRDACTGPHWETSGDFPRLKVLKFLSMEIMEWYVSSDHFPILERLVFSQCHELKKIPSDIGDIPTLQLIEVRLCSYSAELSAKEIQKEQASAGNNWLQIIIESQDYSWSRDPRLLKALGLEIQNA
ncbi:Late blight resistance protein like [Actinidia chinensis var. chinensis]|uniref:Late blight resistance protein like n=1 Tax=Actinidia chinensis var. chinensis TaxID=1590841 RepID=A0A2R6PGM3_ACTCC|nr:Late blight resistance protein like [Actinidia chinensis var. chinensis]